MDDVLKQTFHNRKGNKSRIPGVSQQQFDRVKNICYTIAATADFERMMDPKHTDKLSDNARFQLRYRKRNGTECLRVNVAINDSFFFRSTGKEIQPGDAALLRAISLWL